MVNRYLDKVAGVYGCMREPGETDERLKARCRQRIVEVESRFGAQLRRTYAIGNAPPPKSTVCPCGIHRADCEYHR